MTSPIIAIPCRHDASARHHRLPMQGMGQAYLSAVIAAGGVPVLLPLGLDEPRLLRALDRADGLLLAGGEDIAPALFGEEPHPKLGKVDADRDAVEVALARRALEAGLPLLAICRGIQVLNVAAGGTLYQDIPSQVPGALKHNCFYPEYPRDHIAHAVAIAPDSRLAAIVGQTAESLAAVPVNSLHHQSVKAVGTGLQVVAQAPDGIVEAVEATGEAWVLAVQWHPEELAASRADMAALFRAFVEAAGR
ncbi:MAG: gamma-glutamyl-gamma-aminobutyrate hydrolase family protein [Anaerolineae bacterium]|nr:gamma-glutamyl-gamma-aminobutyrate hydrolase family protein [Anaerolineae bacterium]